MAMLHGGEPAAAVPGGSHDRSHDHLLALGVTGAPRTARWPQHGAADLAAKVAPGQLDASAGDGDGLEAGVSDASGQGEGDAGHGAPSPASLSSTRSASATGRATARCR